MHLVICTRRDVFVVSDRQGILLESVRRFFKALGRFFPEAVFENCEWRSSLADWPEIDAFLSIPRDEGEASLAIVLEVFLHYVLESAQVKKRLRRKTMPLELALGHWQGRPGRLQLTSQQSLRFEDQETIGFIRAESLYPEVEIVENLSRRKFKGLACRIERV